jgi:hypothetical protein
MRMRAASLAAQVDLVEPLTPSLGRGGLRLRGGLLGLDEADA